MGAALFAIFLAADFYSLPRQTYAGGIADSIKHPNIRRCLFFSHYGLVRTATGFEVTTDDSAVAEIMVSADWRWHAEGFWAITRTHTDVVYRVYPGVQPLTQAESDTIQSLVADHIEQTDGDPGLAQRVRDSEWRRSSIRWLGYFHNAVALGALFGVCRSLAWTWEHWAVRRRIRAGNCGNCAYPFAGLPSLICPECGEVRCESETTPL